MEIEINDNAFWATFWICIAAMIMTLIITLTVGYNKRTLAAFESGYEESILTGSSQPHWVKAHSRLNRND